VGHVEDFLVDDRTWAIRYIVVDTLNWLPGRKVVISPGWIKTVSWMTPACTLTCFERKWRRRRSTTRTCRWSVDTKRACTSTTVGQSTGTRSESVADPDQSVADPERS
jgi:hypothetical protein